jgi:predicted DNA binding CopG/RHH family protein
MRREYDFSNATPNPYIKKLRKQISIKIDVDTIDYYKKKAVETGISYQNLINLYLADLHGAGVFFRKISRKDAGNAK